MNEMTSAASTAGNLNHKTEAFASLRRFFYEPATATPLAILRMSMASLLLIQAGLIAPSLFDIYGRLGVLQGGLSDLLLNPDLPSLGGVVESARTWGLSEPLTIHVLFGVYVAGLVGLLLGWHTRLNAFFAWAMHLLFLPSWHVSAYGVDQFATIALFYLMLAPAGHALSLDVVEHRVSSAPTPVARLSLRVLQLHLCVVYFASGFDKIIGDQWQTGEAIWRAVMQPQFHQFDFSWLAEVPWLALALSWGTVLVELAYPVFIWPQMTRRFWAYLTLSLHLGIALSLGINLFSATMGALTVAAFLIPATPSREKRPIAATALIKAQA